MVCFMKLKKMNMLFVLACFSFLSGWMGSSFLHAEGMVTIKVGLRPRGMYFNLVIS